MAKIKNFTIEDARIGFKNFAGKEGKFNNAGRRNFCIFLDRDIAVELEKEGWNVRWLEPKDEQEDKQPYLQVAVNFDNFPPTIVMITNNGKNQSPLDDESVSILDWADIETLDLTVTPYEYDFNGKSGVKAFLKTMYVKIAEDELAQKWTNAPDSAESAMCPDCDSINGSCADCKKCNPDAY